jgi:predicted nuclease with TOPRIM domain
MKIDEHKAILTELNSATIEPARKLELLSKLETDYSVTQAEITTTVEKLTTVEKEKNHFAELSQKLWLENSTALTDIKNNKVEEKNDKIEHQAKRTFESLASKF